MARRPSDAATFLDGLATKKSPIGDDPRIQADRAEAFAKERSSRTN